MEATTTDQRPGLDYSAPGTHLNEAASTPRSGFVLTRYSGCISSSDNLHADSFRIFNMKPRIQVLFRIYPAFFQFPRH